MYEIREAASEDALAINIVNVYTWKTTYTGLMLDSAIDARIKNLRIGAEKCRRDIEENGRTFVVLTDHTVVGFCRYGPSRNEDYPAAGEIYALYVLQGFQGLGIGKALFDAAVKALASEGFASMLVNCLQGNPTLAFYEHMGGRVVGRRQDPVLEGVICEDIVYYGDLLC